MEALLPEVNRLSADKLYKRTEKRDLALTSPFGTFQEFRLNIPPKKITWFWLEGLGILRRSK